MGQTIVRKHNRTIENFPGIPNILASTPWWILIEFVGGVQQWVWPILTLTGKQNFAYPAHSAGVIRKCKILTNNIIGHVLLWPPNFTKIYFCDILLTETKWTENTTSLVEVTKMEIYICISQRQLRRNSGGQRSEWLLKETFDIFGNMIFCFPAKN